MSTPTIESLALETTAEERANWKRALEPHAKGMWVWVTPGHALAVLNDFDRLATALAAAEAKLGFYAPPSRHAADLVPLNGIRFYSEKDARACRAIIDDVTEAKLAVPAAGEVEELPDDVKAVVETLVNYTDGIQGKNPLVVGLLMCNAAMLEAVDLVRRQAAELNHTTEVCRTAMQARDEAEAELATLKQPAGEEDVEALASRLEYLAEITHETKLDADAAMLRRLSADKARLTRERDDERMQREVIEAGMREVQKQRNELLLSSKAKDEALRPFANQASRYDPTENDDCYLAEDIYFTIGDLRHARATLSPAGADASTATGDAPLDEVLDEFAGLAGPPDAATVRKWAERHPEYKREIIAFATDWIAMDAATGDGKSEGGR